MTSYVSSPRFVVLLLPSFCLISWNRLSKRDLRSLCPFARLVGHAKDVLGLAYKGQIVLCSFYAYMREMHKMSARISLSIYMFPYPNLVYKG